MTLEQMQEHAHNYSNQIKYCSSFADAVIKKPNAIWTKHFIQMAEKTIIKLLLEKNPVNDAVNKAI
jgi:recombinational DNA repair protein RecT